MNSLKNILIAIPLGILVVCLFILVFPFLMVLSAFFWIKEKKSKREYLEYLKSIDGSNFFCYNNRKKGRQYIEKQIIPNLPKAVNIVFLNGQNIEVDNCESRYLSRAFYGFKNYTRFPQLLKIRNGEAIDCSINSELFNCLNQGSDENIIYSKMNNFFEFKSDTCNVD